MQHLLSALFIMIESERKKLNPGDDNLQKTQNTTFKNFLRILEENFRRPEGVEYYAEKLIYVIPKFEYHLSEYPASERF